MPHPSKRKGNRFERELVAAGLRAWGSDGRALTTDAGAPCSSSVDVLEVGGLCIQAKRWKAVAAYLKPPAGAHVAAIREDRGEALAVLPLEIFIPLLRSAIPTERGGIPA